MNSHRSIHRLAAASAVAVLGLSLGGMPAPSAKQKPQAKHRKSAPAKRSSQRTVTPESMLRAFRRSRRAEDQLSDEARNSPLIADGVVDPTSSRRVRADVGHGWLLRGRSGRICHLRNGFLNCITSEMLADLRFAPTVSWRGDEVFVEGIATDEVRLVRAVMRGGGGVDAAPADNTVHLRLGDRPVAIEWRTADGRKHRYDVPGGHP